MRRVLLVLGLVGGLEAGPAQAQYELTLPTSPSSLPDSARSPVTSLEASLITTSGRLAGIENGAVTIAQQNGQPLVLEVSGATAITVDGKPAGINQLGPGPEVRAAYQLIAGQPSAVRLEIISGLQQPPSLQLPPQLR